jgi:hypothetical protein
MTDTTLRPAKTWQDRLHGALVAPVQAFKVEYLPPMMVYFAYGALGLTAIASTFWVKKSLTLSPADLAGLSVWLSLPWAMKMVFGELVDTVPIFGSQRRVYIFIGAGLIALAMILLAGAAGGWLTFARPEKIYIAASLLSVLGVVLQDVVADAMTTEVVPRTTAGGTPRPEAEIETELAMVQVLGRLVFTSGMFAVAWLGGYLASVWSASSVFLLGLVIPLVSVTGAMLVKTDTAEHRDTDWRILGGGLAFGALVLALALFDVPYNQELTFLISLGVIAAMLERVTREMRPETRLKILFAAIIIFVFRSTPSTGAGSQWFMMDRYGFDELFYGTLSVIGTAITLVVAWFMADAITRVRMTTVLIWLIIGGLLLSIPGLLLIYEWPVAWTQSTARHLALIDTAATSPLANISMIPLLTLIAIYAPANYRATWFALMSSFMNLALVFGEIGTRWLNNIHVVERGQYAALPALTTWVTIIGVVVPLIAILALRHRVEDHAAPATVKPA